MCLLATRYCHKAKTVSGKCSICSLETLKTITMVFSLNFKRNKKLQTNIADWSRLHHMQSVPLLKKGGPHPNSTHGHISKGKNLGRHNFQTFCHTSQWTGFEPKFPCPKSATQTATPQLHADVCQQSLFRVCQEGKVRHWLCFRFR